MTARRLARFKAALDRRQPDLTVLLDGVHKPHNFSAILRTCDAVGVARAHIVPHGPLPLISGTAQGSEKWVDVTHHDSLRDAVIALRDDGLTLYAAHLNPTAQDFRDVDLTRPCAVVFGTEKFGLDEEAIALVDQCIVIPMNGLVQSLNVSVAAALVLFEAQRQRRDAGLYERPRLPPDEYRRTLFRWMQPKIAARCDAAGLPYPELDEDGAAL